MANRANAILAIASTDRYIKNTNIGTAINPITGQTQTVTQNNQPTSNVLLAEYNAEPPYSNDFQITAPGALINGYINKIIVSQIQLQYNLPTIIPDTNDLFYIAFETGQQTDVYERYPIQLPYGFYFPDELASMLRARLIEIIPDGEPWVVRYGQQNTTVNDEVIGFTIETENPDGLRFFLPNPDQVMNITQANINRMLKTYNLYGFTRTNSTIPDTPPYNILGNITFSWKSPQFLYTPYIDIYSDALTNYQSLKDTVANTNSRKGLIARVYLSGVGNLQLTTGVSTLGCFPFIATFDLNSPKVIEWSPDTAVNSLDFQMRDCYGDLLFCAVDKGDGSGFALEQLNTEWQMTLLCVE